MIDKIKKCIIAGYDSDIITKEELDNIWNYITNLQEEKKIPEKLEEKYYHEESALIDDMAHTINDIIDYLKSKGE